MKFLVKIDTKGLPTTRYSNSAEYDFKQKPDCGDLLFANEQYNQRSICFRDGRQFDEYRVRDAMVDHKTFTLAYDDFKAGETLNDQPEWYGTLRDRIVAVSATEEYGPGQNVVVAEKLVYGCATARIRHVQASWGNAGNLVYCVKIAATGQNALQDARRLHQLILEGKASTR